MHFRLSLAVALGLCVAYCLAGLSGYGNDSDSYLLLVSGQNFWLNGLYTFSRPPSYLIPELIIGAASLIGGHIFSNCLSGILGAATLYLFWRLLAPTMSPRLLLLIVLIIGLNPIYFIAASSSMDYAYSLFFCMAGLLSYQSGKLWLGAALFALAMASRLSNCLIVGLLFGYFFLSACREGNGRQVQRLAGSGAICAGILLILYSPAYVSAGYSLDFLTYAIGDWGFAGYAARFIYKNLCLLGLLQWLVLLMLAAIALIRGQLKRRLSLVLWTGCTIVAVQEALFAFAPLEIAYLLPLLFVIFPLSVKLLALKPGQLSILLLTTFSYGFIVNIDLLDRQYNEKRTEAVSAKPGLFVRRGLIVADLQNRQASQAFYFDTYDIPSKKAVFQLNKIKSVIVRR